MAGLKFSVLRAANLARIPHFKDAQGRRCHLTPVGGLPGYDWSLSQWSNAVLGELGEAANLVKKYERGDFGMTELRPKLAKELADVATYLDILAHRAGIDLGEATRLKWNEVSERVGFEGTINEQGTFCHGPAKWPTPRHILQNADGTMKQATQAPQRKLLGYRVKWGPSGAISYAAPSEAPADYGWITTGLDKTKCGLLKSRRSAKDVAGHVVRQFPKCATKIVRIYAKPKAQSA